MEATFDDFAFALQLQEQFDQENLANGVFIDTEFESEGVSGTAACKDVSASTSSSSLSDKTWELVDPNPDARQLFVEFNQKYFWSKLDGVEVRWSSRMTLCAGVCCYEGRGGLCSIRLSEPLLKFRPRKDLIETLLHEMIHAFLFVTENNRDREGHGPEFQKHMIRLNDLTGCNITIYHSFHDEVDNYRVHWWLCNGVCRSRPPYYGYVKRAMNRAPSSHDPWWADHERTCGGVFQKVKEPEGFGLKKVSNKSVSSGDKGKQMQPGMTPVDKWFLNSDVQKPTPALPQTEVKSTSPGIWNDEDFTGKPACKDITPAAKEDKKYLPVVNSSVSWNDDFDTIADADLVSAADNLQQDKVTAFQGDNKSMFPGTAQTLGGQLAEKGSESGHSGPVVRKLPSFGIIYDRGANDSPECGKLSDHANGDKLNEGQKRKLPLSFSEPTVKSESKILRECVTPGTKSQDAKTFDEFKKAFGLGLTPPGTVVCVKDFTSVCRKKFDQSRSDQRDKHAQVTDHTKKFRTRANDDRLDDERLAKKPKTETATSCSDDVTANCNKNFTLASDLFNNPTPKSVQSATSTTTSESGDIFGNQSSQQCDAIKGAIVDAAELKPMIISIDDTTANENMGSVVDQNGPYVSCPVCHTLVVEATINEHLDQCLN